jgi:hypothetical protein
LDAGVAVLIAGTPPPDLLAHLLRGWPDAPRALFLPQVAR